MTNRQSISRKSSRKSENDLDGRIGNLKGQLAKLEKEELPELVKKVGYVDHEDALAERRYIQYLVLLNQIENLREAILELERMRKH